MQYLQYGEYTALGGKCDLDAFQHYSIRAFAIINYHTKKRVEKMSYVPQTVKCAARDIIDYFVKAENTTNVSSRSHSAGAVSESESYAVKSNADMDADIEQIITDYLLYETDEKGEFLLCRWLPK